MGIFETYFKLFDKFNISLKISIQIFLIILLTFFLSKLVTYVLFFLFKHFAKIKNKLDNSIIVAIRKPIFFFIWLYSFVVSIDLIISRLDNNILKTAINFKYLIIYCLVLNFLLRSTTQVRRHYIIQKEKIGSILDYAGIDAVEKLSKVLIIIIWSIFALGKMGFNLSALLAFGGAGGVLLGFAGKDMFTNVLGGLGIYLNKPFAVGDWISSPDKKIEGCVESIGWVQTIILTFDKYPIYIPNSIFGNIIIENKSRVKAMRIREEIKIRHLDLDKVDIITSSIITMLKEHANINKKYKTRVNFECISDGLITLVISAFTNTTEYNKFCEIKQDILLKIGNIIKDNSAEIASPATTIYMNNNKSVFEKQINIIEDLDTV